MRSLENPYEHFPIYLTPVQTNAAAALLSAIKNDSTTQDDLIKLIHPLIMWLLAAYKTSEQANAFQCPLTRFLIAGFLNKDGQFLAPQSITGRFSRVQWCLRATVANEVIIRRQRDPEEEAG